MSTSDLTLAVLAHLDAAWQPCGSLALTECSSGEPSARFAYRADYLQRVDALPVDPVSLPLDAPTADPVQADWRTPAAGLPLFGGLRDAAPDAWGRRVIESKLGAPVNGLPESTYLLHAGSDRVGALDIRPDFDAPPADGAAPMHALEALMDAADHIDAGRPVPPTLRLIHTAGAALGGARPKATVRDEQGLLWLAKFATAHDRLDFPALETATLRLAAEAGLTVPPVEHRRFGTRSVMLIRRFDRCWATPGQRLADATEALSTHPGPGRAEHRLGFVSGLSLLGCDETESRTLSYAHLAQALRRHGDPARVPADTAELFKRLVFNILVSNDDDHLRNHGFLWTPGRAGWRLSPLYDVMPRASHASERYQHLGVGPQGRLATLDNAVAAHAAFALGHAEACRAVAEVWQAVSPWRARFEAYCVPEADIDGIALAFRHIDEVTTPALRAALP